MKSTKTTLIKSVIALMLCVSLLIGSTFAWFTDNVFSAGNIIASGNLDVEMYWATDPAGPWYDIEDQDNNTVFSYDNWEPGYTEVKYIKIKNAGSLAFNYKLAITPETEVGKLAEVIQVFYATDGIKINDRSELSRLGSLGSLQNVLNSDRVISGTLMADGQQNPYHPDDEVVLTLAMSMITTAGNDYQNETAGEFTITAVATQAPYEKDSFGPDYDSAAELPIVLGGGTVSGTVVNQNGLVGETLTLQGSGVSATVPAGAKLADGGERVTLIVTPLDKTSSGITAVNNEILIPVDVHVEGLAEDNTVPVIVNLGQILPKGLNIGNYTLYHVEDGENQPMVLVDEAADLNAHNNFTYDPLTGEVSVAMATFSEVTLLADTENLWQGNVADKFSGGTGTDADPHIIANADQLAYMGDRVSNDNATYGSAHYQLIADVNFGGTENSQKGIFYPIGYNKVGGELRTLASDLDDIYFEPISPAAPGEKDGDVVASLSDTSWYIYGGAFKGTFDGMGHTITGIYQNTWAMKGDYTSSHYYNAAMGLFGYVYDGTVKNLTIDNFYSEGEYAPTGCVTAYAYGKTTFENIAITNSHPQTYNTGVAGIVGWDNGGDTEAEASNFTFKNITVDDTNTVSALWGSWDVAAAGILGYLGKNSKANFEKCNVAATIDVYNDVCGNYQYYWYRYCGAYIGTVDKRLDGGNGALDLSNVTATDCTINFGDRHEYYYCEFEKNTQASYTEDYQFSRVDHSELNMDINPVTCKHDHTAKEDKQAVYIPFRQLFGGYGWGVDGVDLEEYENIKISDITKSEKKFETKFTGDFLYRVGNQNAVPIDSLFKAKDSATIKINNSGVYVTIDKVDEDSNVSGIFTANTNDWTKGTIQFSGTGVVKVTIQDYDYCKPTTLTLEVVDATNLTEANGTTTGGNFVLLCDVNTSNYVYYWNCSLYGNGFTYSLKGAPTNYSSSHGHGVLMTKNATLDNLVIVGDVYDEYGAYTNNNDYNAAIDIMGDTVIQNCYISGCSAPISARANATITNTTLYGGAVGNLIIKGGVVTLDDVTTANYADGRDLVGMGIVIHSDAAEGTKLILNGRLKQYNFICESKMPTNTYAKNLHNAMFANGCADYHFGTSPDRYVNTGIISLTAEFNGEDIIDNANTGYKGAEVSISGVNGFVYTQPKTSGSVDNKNPEYKPTTQGAVPPSYSFDYTTKNYVAKVEGSNDYCYEENGVVKISMDEGASFNWDTSILTVSKGKETLDYTVSMNGTDYTGKSITFEKTGDYEVVYTYTDDNNYRINANGELTTYKKTYTKTVYISVAAMKASAKNAEFTMGSSKAATEKITIDNATYISAKGVTADNSTWTYITINGQKIYYPIVAAKLTSTKGSSTYAYFPVFENVVTITDYADNGTGDAFTYNSSTTTLPSTLAAVKGIYKAASDVPYWYNLTNSNLTQSGASKIFKWASSSDAPSDPVENNNVLCYKSPQISADRVAYITLVQYSYTDATNTTYYYYVGYTLEAFTKQTTCVTPDTLVTLADGSQKRIDQVTYADQLLVWDFYKGEYAVMPSSIVMNHGYGNYKIVTLTFDDGTVVNTINGHGFFDADTDKFVILSDNNAEQYIGHSFVRDAEKNTTAKLVSYSVRTEYTESWSVLTSVHYNCILEGMLTITPAEVEGSTEYLMPYVIGDDMKYIEAEMQKDIEKYGLYTYEDFADYMTYEQFAALNLQNFKVSVAKGYITWDEIMYLISIHIG